MLEEEFKNVIVRIKNEVKSTQIKTAISMNENLINLYFNLGKIINDNYKYGNKFVSEVSRELKISFPKLSGFSERNLNYMKKFYLEYKDDKLLQRSVAKVPWRHNIALITKVKDKKIRKIYIDATIRNGWSKDMLVLQIESNYYLRAGNSVNNFDASLQEYNSDLVNKIIKDPYVFDFISLKTECKERELEDAMIRRIKDVLLELGKGFSFVGNQYKISTDNNDYYIDLLYYHLDLRCYIVVELKATSFKPEYIGQISFYVKAVDEILKKDLDNPTIGLLLCKEKDRLSVEWSLDTINVPVGVSSFELNKYIPVDILEKLPTEEDINLHVDVENIK